MPGRRSPLACDGRLTPAGGAATAADDQPRLRYAVVASRWGRSLEHRTSSFQMLQQAALYARRDAASFLVADQTAAQPWAERASELFQVPLERLPVPHADQRDRELIAAADKLFAVWVRRGGTIDRLLRQRLQGCRAGDVWVAVTDDPECAGRELVARGAVGWYRTGPHPRQVPPLAPCVQPQQTPRLAQWLDYDWPQYLVHCTRQRRGTLPGQSVAAWRDELLLGGEAGRPATPFEVLTEIVHSGWLRGSAKLTQTSEPVICWSAVPLPELLGRRTFRPHLGRWDYEPYGLAICRDVLKGQGAQPVVYAATRQQADLPPPRRWLFQASGRNGQWQEEREWRMRGSLPLEQIGEGEAVVFVAHRQEAEQLQPGCRWPVIAVA